MFFALFSMNYTQMQAASTPTSSGAAIVVFNYEFLIGH